MEPNDSLVYLIKPPREHCAGNWLTGEVSQGSIDSGFIEAKEYLGMAYCASVLEQHNFRVEIIDCDTFQISHEDVLSKIKHPSLILIGINGGYSALELLGAAKMAERIKQVRSDVHITLGGYLPTLFSRMLLYHFKEIDSITRGEGEMTLCELADTLLRGDRLEQVNGLSFKGEDDVVVHNPARALLPHPDQLPFPVRYGIKETVANFGHVRILSSRGCQGRCSFCMHHQFYNGLSTWRYRSPKHVVDELEFLYKTYNTRLFEFYDENFFGHHKHGPERAKQIANEIIKRKLDIQFMIDSRLDDIDPELLACLKESGLKTVFIGVESHCLRALEWYNKNYTVNINDCADLLKSIYDLDIEVNIGYIWYDPYTSFAELKKTVEFLSSIRNYTMITGTPLVILPGLIIAGTLSDIRFKQWSPYHGFQYDFQDKAVGKIDHLMKEHLCQFQEMEFEFSKWVYQCRKLFAEILHKLGHLKDGKLINFRKQLRELDRTVHNSYLDILSMCIDMVENNTGGRADWLFNNCRNLCAEANRLYEEVKAFNLRL